MKFTQEMLAGQMQTLSGSAIREIFHLLSKPGMISFAGGNPAASALEPDVIAELGQKALEKHGWMLLQYGATEGFTPLRESIAEYVRRAGVETQPEKVFPTQGSQQAMDLLAKALLNPGDAVLVESPTFLGVLQTLRTYKADLKALETDEGGVIVDAAEEAIRRYRPKLMYVIPTFQNPTGRTLALERREKLAALAAKYGVVLAEDDPYREVRFTGTPLPSVKSFDKEGWVVYLGSFSKTIAPGLRVGYAVVDNEELMQKMVIGKQATDVHSPLLNQAIVDGYLRSGRMDEHLKRICADYKARLDVMLDGLDRLSPWVTHTVPEGGLFVWAALPEGADALAMLTKAVEKNVAYVPGTHFYFDGGRLNTIRLNFSNGKSTDVAEGMARLTPVILETIDKLEGSK
jgi:2-aminoadipate transaminase